MACLPAARPARHQDDGEIRRLVVGLGGQRDHFRVRHGAALDIDGARQPAAAFERAAQLRQMPADLHHHGGVGLGEPARQLAFGQRRRQHGEDVVALRDRHSGRRPAARHAGDAGDDLGGEPRRQPRVQMHVGAVEQRIALADHGDDAAGVEMRGDFRRGAVVEIADGVAIAVAVRRQFGGDRDRAAAVR